MTSRKRSNTSTFISAAARSLHSKPSTGNRRAAGKKVASRKRRQHLLETLEPRQLLAGPQLIGIQPNEGDLIVSGSVRDTAPRVLTFRFDQNQQIDPTTFEGIRVTRAGDDGLLGTADDVRLNTGLVTLGDNAPNEVVVRFAEKLPDDQYKVEVFGFDDPGLGVTGLRNLDGELFQPSGNQRSSVTNFQLRLGALIEAIVPQPVVRLADGSLVQNRNEIVVYFNEDPLFVEDEDTATGTIQIGNERIIVTANLVGRTFNDTRIVFNRTGVSGPATAVHDPSARTLTVTYPTGTTFGGIATAINSVPNFSAAVAGGNASAAFIQPPAGSPPIDIKGVPTARSAENPRFYQLLLTQDTVRTTDDALYNPREVVYDAATHTARLIFADDINELGADTDGNAGVAAGGGTFRLRIGTAVDDRMDVILPPVQGPITSSPGDTLGTALNVGVFGQNDQITSLVFSETIEPQSFNIELPGGNDDPGRLQLPEVAGGGLVQYINSLFGQNGADITNGITEISYNFNGVFARSGGNSFLNQITERQKERIREALNLWSSQIGVQFRETVDQGITFAVGDSSRLQPVAGTRLQPFSVLNAQLRIDPTYTDSAIVFSNQANFNTAYGEDFLRKATAGIGLLLGLEQAPGLPSQTLMTLTSSFLNATINPANETILRGLEPVFPGNQDVLHGQYLHRPDSLDVDLYRFVVDINDDDRVGTLTAETFAERLADSSSLDTTLTLFQEFKASATTDFDLGNSLSVRFEALAPGELGNNTRIDFFRSDRPNGDRTIRISQPTDNSGNPIANAVVVDLPRRGGSITSVSVSDVISAINSHPFASSVVRASLETGAASTDISGPSLNVQPVLLAGGELRQLNRNDDYFSEDSRIIATLGAGTYYIGVAASGNNTYDPTIPNSGFGGLTQGAYDLHLKFEPAVDEVDVLRDLDSDRVGVPGTPVDGDGDGTPGGVHNFWFQTRPLNRTLNFTANGAAINSGQTITVTGGNGVVRTYEFVPTGVSPQPGNVPVFYNPGAVGVATPSSSLASALQTAVNSRRNETGVSITTNGSSVEFQGERSIQLSNNFRGGEVFGRNIFVDKAAGPLADGSLSRPFNNIANPAVPNAFGATLSGDIVRIVGNGGLDGNVATEADNFSYKVGVSETGGVTLEDGRNIEVPQGVTTMIDAGAVIKLRSARIGVGSSTLLENRSEGALQVLGTPRLVQLSVGTQLVTTSLINDVDAAAPLYSDGSVIFTSIKDRAADVAAAGSASTPAPGDWGGLVFRRDVDNSEGRFNLEDEGVFLQHVNHAQIRYGGGSNLLIDSVQQLVNPIQIFELRPTVSFNEISFSADAAISASPDSFEETSYQAPRFQQAGQFTADYSRIGPAINNNQLIDNSINGLFIRVVTTPGTPPRQLTLAGRLDDIDVVHYLAENVIIAGTPGGSIQDGVRPDLASTAFAALNGGRLAAGTYDYRLTFVDANGFESLASTPSATITVSNNQSIQLLNLPPVPATGDYVSRRLYRLDPGSGQYRLTAMLDANDSNFIDDGSVSQGVLDLSRVGIRGRLDASLVVDPGMVMKFRGARLELGQGTQLLAEGTVSNPVIFTSYADDRFGSGGTFDTNNDNGSAAGEIVPARGDWSGIYAAPTAFVSLDNATVAYGGGVSLLEGGQSRGFAALELQQADARVANSRFEFNEDGQDGAGPVGRFGRLGITPSTIFVRGSQPTIVGNTFVDNRGSIIDIDSDSMNAERLVDLGRQTGAVDRFDKLDDNYGPLIRLNRYSNVAVDAVANRQITGLEIRGGVLTTESVWDDTDIVHLLFDSVEVGNFHSSGGLRLLSRSDESLVVKLTGPGTAFSETSGTGLTATGALSDIADRIGGSVHIVGLPGAPVVLTSFADDSVGAGLTPEGVQFTDNNGDGSGSRPEGNDWRSVLLDQYSNDRNVDYILERTIISEVAPGLNGTIANAQVLGALAPNVLSGDEQLRLGFEVEGFLSEDRDVDTYSFTAEAGTRIWVDIDRTTFTLDSVIEILDANGNVLARSDNSFDEVAGTPLQDVDPLVASTTRSLQGNARAYTEFGVGGLYEDFGSINPRDAGIQLSLPGNRGTRSVYFFRVRSASVNPDDAAGGITHGGYRFQVRLREDQEFPGSVVRYADIRFANHGVHLRGLPGSSPLLGEAQENEVVAGFNASNDRIASNPAAPGQRAQYLGNLSLSEDKVFSVGGELSNSNDIDFYQIDVNGSFAGLQSSAMFDIDYADGFSRPNTTLLVFYDADGESGPIPARLVFMGEDSNVLDDQAQPVSRSAIDLLTRGSVSTGDPLIGPVSLSAGTYFVGVVGDGVRPDALSNLITRREPIESILRIFEDHVEATGGSTAAPPREGSFIDRSSLPPGWTVTTARATDPGHQRTQTFNGSRQPTVFPPSVQFENSTQGGSFATAQDLSAGDPQWSLADDPNIGSINQNTSQLIPHTTVNGTTPNEIVDIYRFDVSSPNALVILDIDNGFNPFTTDPTQVPPGTPPTVDPNSVDLKIQLFDSAGVLIATNSTSQVSEGALGSLGNNGGTSPFTNDPFIQRTLTAGTYFVAVSPELTTFDAATLTFDLAPADRPASGTYQLHVSVEGHPNDGGDPGNQSYNFDRSEPNGTLNSVPFDLTGYGPADLPRFYFSYFYDPSGNDAVTVRAFSDQNPGGSVLGDVQLFANPLGNTWSQSVASLSAFAGHTGITVQFVYNTDTGASGGEGLYLDDFLVGFAERGELITNASPGVTGVSGASATAAGEYQLEVRPGTVYGTPIGTGLRLDSTFDTNARQTRAATIVAPHADQIEDGDTFTLSDGVRTVRFEFDLDTAPGVSPGNIRVPYSNSSTQAQIADALRTAINLPVVQSTLKIQASDSTGSATGGFRDIRVAISGLLLGDFIELSSPQDLPPSGQPLDPSGAAFRLPVVFNQGVGDENVERAQSQVIIDSTKISDVRAIGIWSQFADRAIDPEDNRNDLFMLTPQLGSTSPGAVRNLPTLNNSVVGGIAPSLVAVNNTIDQAGYAGIKVDGQTRPWVIDSNQFLDFGNILIGDLFGELIADGLSMVVDAGDTRVVFEFEDISGDTTAIPHRGSGAVGGDGWVDGHVPIYIRHDAGPYNVTRDTPHTRHEVMLSIYESILGSILVTNGLVELVEVSLGPSMFVGSQFANQTTTGFLSDPAPAVYLQGVTNIFFTSAYQKVPGGNPFTARLAPVHDAPQPFARLVNNTIYGEDGRASLTTEPGTLEPNDVLAQAVDTRAGNAHTGPYFSSATIGDSTALIPAAADVDFYEVELKEGDRLTIDVDTLASGPDTVLRVFDSKGVEVAFNSNASAPDYLETATNPANFDSAGTRTVDPYIDFTATKKGTYYVAVSSEGNNGYDPRTISGRVAGTGGTGDYDVAIEVFAPRSFVMAYDDNNNAVNGSNTGSDGTSLIGTTFTITQIPDRLETVGTANQTNEMTFEFVAGGAPRRLANGNVPVPLRGNPDEFRVPDVMRAISNAITGFPFVNSPTLTNPPLPNHAFANGPDGLSGPIAPVTAQALGGEDGDAAGLFVFPFVADFQNGFGHSRTNQVGSIGFAGTTTLGDGTTELYVFVERAAKIELSPEAAAAGLRLDPNPGRNTDQLLPEAGVILTGGSSATLVNNVFANLHQSVVREESKFNGFGGTQTDLHPKPSQVIVTGNVFQDDEPLNTGFRTLINLPGTNGVGLSTDAANGPSNVNGGNDDFNVTLNGSSPLFVNADGDRFLPNSASFVIDSAINSLVERDAIANLRQSVGLPVSNLLAPARDVNGVLRADNPNVAPPGGLGGQVFKDRGSNELADFVGPVVIPFVPLDNDAEGNDSDPATSFLQLADGVFREFRIQLRDTGDASDPFTGLGIDDDTVVVAPIPGLRPAGANVTLFENDRLLTEGVDYTFNYDETQNVITLTPLAGVWRNDRAYEVKFNNRNRTVLVAPDPSVISDGDQVTVTDTNGGTLVFEFELGFSLFVPEPITLVVPQVGTNAGGLGDGDIFQIDDGFNPVVVFEFNRDSAKLPGTVEVPLPAGQTPADDAALQSFLTQIASNIAAAIQSQADAGRLNVDVRVVGTSVVVGAEPGATATTSGSGLQQLPRTLALNVPAAGFGLQGIQDGDTFVVDNGDRSVTFEFDSGNGLNSRFNTAVPVAGLVTANELAIAIQTAVAGAGLGLNPSISADGRSVYLNLPLNGSALVPQGQLTLVGLSRTPIDGETIVITPSDGSPAVTLEINRTDEPDANGLPMDDGVTAPNVPINITRGTTANEFAGLIANAIQSQPPLAGLNLNDLQPISGGLLAVGGSEGLGLTVTGNSLEVTGTPSVTGASTIEVFGPLLLQLPQVGGGGITNNSVLVIEDAAGNDVIFEFVLTGNPSVVAGSIVVRYDTFSTVDVVANNLIAAINGANVGFTAQNLGTGRVSFGRIDQSRVNINGIIDPANPNQFISGLSGSSLRRGIVNDGEVFTIRQGNTQVSFEFEATQGGGGTRPGNIAVPFQVGSTVADVAVSLAAAINNNKGNLRLNAVAELDAAGNPTGSVKLNDQPGTIIDVSAAPTLNLIGVPGGATPVRISPAFTATEVKFALIQAINSVNQPGQPPVTTLSAVNRGGATLFVENGTTFAGPLASFALPAIADVAGNPLEPNRADQTTQVTYLLSDVDFSLDFGDAPDPVRDVPGRYPTLASSDGPRHVIDGGLKLGNFVDADRDGISSRDADGDDLAISITSTGTLFGTSIVGSAAQIVVQTGTVNPLLRDGDTITIDTGVAVATLEFDLNGRFDEDNFAIRPVDPTSPESITAAIVAAINESPLRPANVTATSATVLVDADDEDGVVFTSETNPNGILNRGMALPIEVSVTGSGVLEAWIDFNADGDWDDPGEQVLPMQNASTLNATRNALCPADIAGVTSNLFADTGTASTRTFCIVVPPTTPVPTQVLQTYARFRVSRDGGLSPTGLALSGEVEDYALTLVPGLPPSLNNAQANRSFTVNEDQTLQALDANGSLTTTANDNGLLAGVVDVDGDAVEIFADDVGTRTLLTPQGAVAGELNLFSDGTFTFEPTTDFNGVTTFSARVTDINPIDPAVQLVNSRPITVTINVAAVNDPPVATVTDVTVTRTINEDAVQTFGINDVGSVEGLIGDKFSPGPDNESDQPLIIESAGSVRGAFLTTQGGRLTIADGGQTVIYTPPADYNGPAADTFTYVVADVPGAGQISESAVKRGTVTINFVPVNDAPRLINDNYVGDEGELLTIAINGTAGNPGILDNDLPGPPDEVNAGQTISLVAGQFPKATTNGGSVRLVGGSLEYDPPTEFSGLDQFQYSVTDNLGATATATVSINVGGVNNAPVFIGVDGDPAKQSIVRNEAKVQSEQVEFDLSTWFRDPEDDALTFTVTSGNSSIVSAVVDGKTLTLTFPPFGFGETTLTVTATDPSGLSDVQPVPVKVNDTPDPPSVIGTLNPLRGTEDQLVVADLSTVFADPDATPLQYQVARIGSVVNPTAAQIAQHPLVQSISFVGDQMRIQLKPNQSGAVDLEIAATDNSFRVSDSFTLTVAAVPDAPVANADGYNVPVGTQLQIVNPGNGLLRNDSDADGDAIKVDLTSVVGPTRGTLQLNEDGTFTYTNQSGAVNDVDSFSYRLLDATGRPSNTVTVTLTLNQSRYQNPLADLAEDVNADGLVSAIDALRIINFLNRELVNDDAISVPVSQIGTPPPDFLDTNGDGRVSASDALRVINRLSRVNPAQREQLSSLAASSITTSYVSGSTMLGLPIRNLQPVSADEPLTTATTATDPRDLVLTAGFEIDSTVADQAAEAIGSENQQLETSSHSIDAALSSLLEDHSLSGSMD